MHATEPPHHDAFDFSGLTIPERITLAQQLWESVRDQIERQPLNESDLAEVRRRVDAIDKGLMVCETFDSVMAYAAGR